jgi:hypothetical protein
MSDLIEVSAHEGTIEVRATGKLTKEFYENFVPVIEEQIKQFGKVRLLFVMLDFHGWTAGALWEDLKFDLKHWRDLDRLALVGDSKWEQSMATFCKPFTKATVKYFDETRLEEARTWLHEN